MKYKSKKGKQIMAKKNVTIYTCDCCKKEFPVESSKTTDNLLYQVNMPSRIYDCEGRSYSEGLSRVELCSDCYLEFWNYVQAKYQVNELYDVSIKKMF